MEQDEKNDLVKANMEKWQAERKEAMIKYWNELKPFETPADVPSIPRVDEKEYKEFYVPRLIAAGAIPKADLVDKQFYFTVDNSRHSAANVYIIVSQLSGAQRWQ